MSLFCFQPYFKLCWQPLLSASLTTCLRFPFLGAMILILTINVHWALDQSHGHILRPAGPAGRIPPRQLCNPQGAPFLLCASDSAFLELSSLAPSPGWDLHHKALGAPQGRTPAAVLICLWQLLLKTCLVCHMCPISRSQSHKPNVSLASEGRSPALSSEALPVIPLLWLEVLPLYLFLLVS